MAVKLQIREDNTEKALREFFGATEGALRAIGMQAASHAAVGSPVDTGRLRNSMTYELGDRCVFVGTNVYYAIYQELGTSRIRGKHMIRNAATNHTAEYKQILERFLKR